ncbi:ATP-grasp domain-containing protein [Streptomyces sp. NPDC026672]|uniref:ATP-grasp domain-containing protein n=1 Tax=unclassified Streptomyces TaxID=2593676 RepID=UPI0033C13C7B
MAHLVLVESTPTAGLDVVRVAESVGHQVTFMAHDVRPYLVSSGADEAIRSAARVRAGVRTTDEDAILDALRELHAEVPVDGVLTLSDAHLLPTTRAATRFGIAAEDPEAVARLRDKHLMRRALRDAKVPQPHFAPARTPDEAVAAAGTIGTPVVVKPADGFSSIHVGVARTPQEVRTLAEAIVSSRGYGRGFVSSGLILVERYVPGPLLSCEVATVRGQHLVYGCVDRHHAEGTSTVEMGGCFPADLPPSVTEEVARVCTAALDALGLRRSFSHTELVLGPEGPRIIEVNGRLIGGLVPAMMNGVLARPVHQDLIEVALGGLPPAPVTTGTGCIRSITAPCAGRLRGIDVEEARAVDGVRAVVLQTTDGQRVRPPRDNRDRLGFIISAAADARAARHAADTAHARVRVLVEPETDTPTLEQHS